MDQEKDLQELTAEELVEEISEEIVEPSVEDAAPAKHEKAKTPIWAIVVIAVLALALIATAAFAFIRLRPEAGSETIAVEPHHINAHGYPSWALHFSYDEEGNVDEYYYLDETAAKITLSEEEVALLGEQVVAICEDQTLNNRDLQFYFSDNFSNFYNQNYSYLTYLMDPTAPLDSQLDLVSGENASTWQKYFLDGALNKYVLTTALSLEAQENGFVLNEDQQMEMAEMTDLHTAAMASGFESEDDLIQAYYGPWATAEGYIKYMESSIIASYYLEQLESGIVLDDAAIEAFYDANATDYTNMGIEKNNQPATMDVRHILIQPEASEDGTFSEEAWAAADTEAQRILAEWQAGDATEDSFAALAGTYSTDPGSSSNGGLYEDVVPGQMVTEFNDWCFDPARQTGDTGIVKTSYGYHIMFFSSASEELYWKDTVKADLLYEEIAKLSDEIVLKYDSSLDYSKAIVLEPTEATVPGETTDETVAPAE